jgi:hypothetical protein
MNEQFLLVKVWVSATNVTDVALEVLNVDGIEADDGREKADVLLCQAVAEVEWAAGLCEICFCAIERGEECGDGLFVRFLSSRWWLVWIYGSCGWQNIRSKARFVDTIVDIVVSPLVSLLDLGLQVLRKENHVLILVFEQVVEFGVEHANDLARLVADDGVLLGVIKRGDRESTFVVLIHVKVDVTQVSEALVDGVRPNILARLVVLGGGKAPALLEHFPVDGGVRDDVLETLEFTNNQSPVCCSMVSF